MPRLIDLPAGTKFRVPEIDLTATLLMVNECRARVRIDHGSTLVEFRSGWRKAIVQRSPHPGNLLGFDHVG